MTTAATQKFPGYNQQSLFDAVRFNTIYTFGFRTGDYEDLNIAGPEFLIQGYPFDLARLRTIRRSLSAMLTATPQVETLYHASKLVDLLWVRYDAEADEIVGTWHPHERQ